MAENKPISLKVSITYFIISILINSFGNGLTVATNMGSAFWTASAVNVSKLIGIGLSLTLIIYGAIIVLVNSLLVGKFQPRRVLGNFIFMFPFSYLVGFFTSLLLKWDITSLPIWLKIIIDIIGICFIAIGISIYQRVNLMLHPNDDLMQTIRFKYVHGNSTIANWISFTPPIIIIIICYFISGHIYAINIGSLFALLFQGSVIGLADKIIFPSLKHQRLDKMVKPK